jgi:hypothetical protein
MAEGTGAAFVIFASLQQQAVAGDSAGNLASCLTGPSIRICDEFRLLTMDGILKGSF